MEAGIDVLQIMRILLQPYQQSAKEAQVEPNVPEYIKSVYGIGYKFEI